VGPTRSKPIVELLDLLGRRWALRLLWELRTPAGSFRELQARCEEMSSSVLSQRLSELRAAGLVLVAEPGGYELSEEGRELVEVLLPLDDWAKIWTNKD
jgi:DNA-binding HxlR family transcriptional regulator